MTASTRRTPRECPRSTLRPLKYNALRNSRYVSGTASGTIFFLQLFIFFSVSVLSTLATMSGYLKCSIINVEIMYTIYINIHLHQKFTYMSVTVVYTSSRLCIEFGVLRRSSLLNASISCKSRLDAWLCPIFSISWPRKIRPRALQLIVYLSLHTTKL